LEEIMPLEMETVETLEAAALNLPPGERARLVERLIATLDADPEIEEAWAVESLITVTVRVTGGEESSH
jgi:hypothetical protein